MGLLDFLQTPAGQGLLSGVASYAAGARRGTPINNLGRGLAGGLSGYSNAQDQIQKDAEQKLLDEYRKMQMNQMHLNQQQLQNQQDMRQKVGALFQPKTVTTPVQPGSSQEFQNFDNPNFTPGVSGGLLSQSQPRSPQEIAQGLLSTGDPSYMGMGIKMMQPQNAGPASVQEWQYYNSMSPQDQARYLRMKRSTQKINLGNRVIIPNQNNPSGPPSASYGVGLNPKDLPSTKYAQTIAKGEAGKALQAGAAAAKAEMSLAPLNRMGTTVNELLNSPGLDRITGVMSYLPNISPEARNSQAKMKTLRSQVAQSVLQMYRNMSQTGGAVGQVSNFEQEMFQNNLASLDQSQTPEEFKNQLAHILEFVKNSRKRINVAYKSQYGKDMPGYVSNIAKGQGQTDNSTPPPPAGFTVIP